jgi:hypothetical protein
VATVSPSGLVTGVAEGPAVITVTTEDGGYTATCNVTVTIVTIVTLTLQENEDGFCSVDGDIDSEHSGHTGTGYANTDNALDNGITWSVNIPLAGSYSILWRYANGASSDRTAQLMEDGTTLLTGISMPTTGAWDSWASTTAVDVTLSAGDKLIRLQATTSSGLANIDYMEVTGENPVPVACEGLKSAEALTGIAENNTGLDINCYPIPVSNLLNIEFSSELTETVDILLLDVTGKTVMSVKASGLSHTLDMSGLPEGLYMVRVSGTNLNKVMRITKQ